MRGDQPVLRRARDADAAAVADVWLRSFAAALPSVRRAHGDDEVRRWFAEFVIPYRETWVAEVAGVVVGLMVLAQGELTQLYVAPWWWGRGLGSRLVGVAKQRRPMGLELSTFQVNTAARRFYARHGFVKVERTDGSGNEELEPDIRLRWDPSVL